ncbi:hypothetical protein [Nostoc sp. DedVER01b]|uniref:hypothetical protein n=1 Tax=Nostoc sp. DedVER01b TaxID=3075404 RepID=UPI002ADB008C|nr:hypothetical protein [Nostoc sp. DedVER01b]
MGEKLLNCFGQSRCNHWVMAGVHRLPNRFSRVITESPADVGYWSDGMLVRNLTRRFILRAFVLEKLLLRESLK